jgi:hypothetical protein
MRVALSAFSAPPASKVVSDRETQRASKRRRKKTQFHHQPESAAASLTQRGSRNNLDAEAEAEEALILSRRGVTGDIHQCGEGRSGKRESRVAGEREREREGAR